MPVNIVCPFRALRTSSGRGLRAAKLSLSADRGCSLLPMPARERRGGPCWLLPWCRDLLDLGQVRLEGGQQLDGNRLQTGILARGGVALEQRYRLDMRLVLGVDIDLVEIGTLQRGQRVH